MDVPLWKDQDAVRTAAESVARNSEGVLTKLLSVTTEEKLKRYSEEAKKRKTLRVYPVLDSRSKDRLSEIYPEVNLEFVCSSASDHGMAAARRELYQEMILRRLPNTRRLIDVGGNYAKYLRMGVKHVHCCAPNLDARDASRIANREIEITRHINSAATSPDLNKKNFCDYYLSHRSDFYCHKKSQECTVQGDVALFVNSLYDIPVCDVARTMASHGCSSGYGVMLFCPEMCFVVPGRTARGVIPDQNCTWIVEERSVRVEGFSCLTSLKKRIIRFYFNDSSAFGYEHDFDNYMRLATQTCFDCEFGGQHMRYVVERSYRHGSLEMQMHRVESSAGSPTSLTFRYWRDTLHNKVPVRIYDYEGIGTSKKLDHMREDVVFMDKNLFEKTISYGLRLSEDSFNPATIYSFAFSANYKLTFNGVEVTVNERTDAVMLYKLVHSLFFICFQLKYNQRSVCEAFLSRELARRNLRSAGLLGLAKAYFSGNVSVNEMGYSTTCMDKLREYVAATVGKSLTPAAPGVVESVESYETIEDWFDDLDTKIRPDVADLGEYRQIVDACNRVAEPMLLQKAADEVARNLRLQEDSSAAKTQLRLVLVELLKRMVVVCPDRVHDFGASWSKLEVVRRALDDVAAAAELPSYVGGAGKVHDNVIKDDERGVAVYVRTHNMDVIDNKGDGYCGAYAVSHGLTSLGAADCDFETVRLKCQQFSGKRDWFDASILEDVCRSHGKGFILLHRQDRDTAWNVVVAQYKSLSDTVFILNDANVHYMALVEPGQTQWRIISAKAKPSTVSDISSEFNYSDAAFEDAKVDVVAPSSVSLCSPKDCYVGKSDLESVGRKRSNSVPCDRTFKPRSDDVVPNSSTFSQSSPVLAPTDERVHILDSADQSSEDIRQMESPETTKVPSNVETKKLTDSLVDSVHTLSEIMGSPVYKGLSPTPAFRTKINFYRALAVTTQFLWWITCCSLTCVYCSVRVFSKNSTTHGRLCGLFLLILTCVMSLYLTRPLYMGLTGRRYGKVTVGCAVYKSVGVVVSAITALSAVAGFASLVSVTKTVNSLDMKSARKILDYPIFKPTQKQHVFNTPVASERIFQTSRYRFGITDDAVGALLDTVTVFCLFVCCAWFLRVAISRLRQFKTVPKLNKRQFFAMVMSTLVCSGHSLTVLRLIVSTVAIVPGVVMWLWGSSILRGCAFAWFAYKLFDTDRDDGRYRSFNVVTTERTNVDTRYVPGAFEGAKLKLGELVQQFMDTTSLNDVVDNVVSSSQVRGDTSPTPNLDIQLDLKKKSSVRTDLLTSYYAYVLAEVRAAEGHIRSQFQDVSQYGDVSVRNRKKSKPIHNFDVLKKVATRKFALPSKVDTSMVCAFDPKCQRSITGDEVDGALVPVLVQGREVMVDIDTDVLYVSDTTRACLSFSECMAVRDNRVTDVDPTRRWLLIDGVPGNGKTTELVNTMTEDDAVAIATKLAASDCVDKAVKSGKSGRNIKTVGSRIINGNFDCKSGRLLVDEGLMVNPGQLVLLAELMNAREIIVYGDSVQIPFSPRVPGFVVPHMKNGLPQLGWEVKCRSVTHRCPKDVAVALRRYYTNGVWSTSDVLKSVKIQIIRSIEDVKPQTGTKVIVFTQSLKIRLTEKGVSDVNTVNEVQGQTFDNVVMVRSEVNLDDNLRNSVGQAVVALSRHRKSFVYCTVEQLSNNKDKLFELCHDAMQLSDVDSDHGKIPPQTNSFVGGAKKRAVVVDDAVRDARVVEKLMVAHGAYRHQPQLVAPGYDESLGNTPDRVTTRAPRVTVYKCPDPREVLQTVLDVVLPGNSDMENRYDNSMIQYSDMSINLTADMVLNMTKHDTPLKKRNTFEPLLRTSMGPPRPPTMRGAILSLRKRNFGGSTQSLPLDSKTFAIQAMDRMMDTFCVPDWRERLRAMDPIVYSKAMIEEWMRLQTSATKNAVDKVDFMTTADEIRSGVRDYSVILKAMPKTATDMKVQTTYPAVQTIMFHSKEVNALFGPIMRTVDRRFTSLLRPNVLMNKRKNQEAIEGFLNTKATDFGANDLEHDDTRRKKGRFRSFECDFSDYDRCQKEVAFHLDRELITRMGLDLETTNVWSDGHYENSNMAIQLGLRTYLKFQRKSGDVTTSLGNTVLNMTVVAWCMNLQPHEWKLAMFLGDDSWMSVKTSMETDDKLSRFSRQACDYFGLEAKAGLYKTGYFCGFSLLETEDGVQLMSDPFRRAVKLGRWDVKSEDEFKEHWVSFRDTLRNYDDLKLIEKLATAMEERVPRAKHGLVVEMCVALNALGKSYKTFRRMWGNEKTVTEY